MTDKHYKWIDQKAFDMIKSMLNNGVKTSIICQIRQPNYSVSTISRINSSDTLQDYKESVRESNLSKKKNAPYIPTYPDKEEQVVFSIQEILFELKRIATGIESLAEAWKVSPAKKETMDFSDPLSDRT